MMISMPQAIIAGVLIVMAVVLILGLIEAYRG